MRTDKLYLVGFMGAGKSTVAKALAARLGWSLVDLDALIEDRQQRSIAEIFEEDGEAEFRRLERGVIQELLPRRRVVVATGGGTFPDATNRALIADDGASIWLDVSFESVLRRLPPDGQRPLARDRTRMQALWADRRAAYGLAQRHVDTNGRAVGDVVDEIVDWLEH